MLFSTHKSVLQFINRLLIPKYPCTLTHKHPIPSSQEILAPKNSHKQHLFTPYPKMAKHHFISLSYFRIFTHTFHKVTPTTYYTHILIIMGMIWHMEILFKHLLHQMDTLSLPSFHLNFSSFTCNNEDFNPCLLLL